MKQMSENEPVPEAVQQMQEKIKELAPKDRPRLDLNAIRNKSSGTYEAIAEFENGEVIVFTLNKSVPYDVQEKMYDDEIISMDEDNELKVDLKGWSRGMWTHLVHFSDPKIDLDDLRTLPQEFAMEIIGYVFDQWQKHQVDVPKIKKN